MKYAWLLLLVLCASIAIADNNVTGSRTPNATATFNENVTLNTLTLLRGVNSVSINYTGSSGATNFSLQFPFTTLFDFLKVIPLSPLENRIFTFSLNVSDNSTLKNSAAYNFAFNVSAPGQELLLIDPAGGGFNTSDVNITVQSDVTSQCRWTQDDNAVTNPAWFWSNMHAMDSSDLRLHHITHLFNSTNTPVTDGATVSLSVTCNDTATGLLSPMVWLISYHNESPTITFTVDPATIIDPTRPYTTLIVDSNQEVWCTLSDKGLSQDPPDIFGPQNYDQFNASLYGTLDVPTGVPPSFNVTVACINRAAMQTKNTTLINVDYAVPVVINVLSPPAWNTLDYPLNFSTNIASQCTVFRDTTAVRKNAAVQDPTVSWWGTDHLSSAGIYTYRISCSVPGVQNKTQVNYTVLIDNTPPALNSLDGSGLSCSLQQITFSYNVTPSPPSPIVQYNYSIRDSQGNVLIPMKSSTSAIISQANLNLTNASEYTISGLVIDSAGNVGGPAYMTIKASTNQELGCDNIQPGTGLLLNYTLGVTTIQFMCSDNVACKDEYRWEVADPGDACNVSTSDTAVRPLNTTQTITNRSTVCWIVSDTNNNVVRKEQVVNVITTANNNANNTLTNQSTNLCANRQLDQSNYETDVDCGGFVCAGNQGKLCPDNDSCNANADCSGGWCNSGVCQSASCTDGVKNGQETGVDCGSSCSPCTQENSGCSSNSDCGDGKTCIHQVCVDPGELQTPQKENPTTTAPASSGNLLSMLFIIFGSLLTMAGIGTIVLYAPPKQKQTQQEDQEPIVPFEEQALSHEPSTDAETSAPTKQSSRKRIVKKQRRIQVFSEFDTPEELSELKNVSHKHLEAAYDKFDKKDFTDTTKQLIEDGKVEKKDVAIAIADIASKGKADDEAIDDLKKEFGIEDGKEKEEKP